MDKIVSIFYIDDFRLMGLIKGSLTDMICLKCCSDQYSGKSLKHLFVTKSLVCDTSEICYLIGELEKIQLVNLILVSSFIAL